MSGLVNDAEQMFESKENNQAQAGDQVESRADNAANSEINNVASDFGVPQQADGMIDKMADSKINQDLPGGNN